MDDEPAPTAAPTGPPLAGLLGVLREEPGLLGALGRRSTVLVLPDASHEGSTYGPPAARLAHDAALVGWMSRWLIEAG